MLVLTKPGGVARIVPAARNSLGGKFRKPWRNKWNFLKSAPLWGIEALRRRGRAAQRASPQFKEESPSVRSSHLRLRLSAHQGKGVFHAKCVAVGGRGGRAVCRCRLRHVQ